MADSTFVLQANCNEIVLASTHDVQELDVTSLLACQPYIWIGEEFDRESKRCVLEPLGNGVFPRSPLSHRLGHSCASLLEQISAI